MIPAPPPDSVPPERAAPRDCVLRELSFDDLDGFADDDHDEAFRVFARSCARIVAGRPSLRAALAPSPALAAVCRRALDQNIRDRVRARAFFETHFRPFRVEAKGSNDRAVGASAGDGGGFLTGYYEPVVEGSPTPSPDFTAPILARPDDLSAHPDAGLAPYPDRAAIEAGAIAEHAAPIVWLRDSAEVFLVQVQGSARVRLPDGHLLRLVYAGRNGRPYTSIGRILIESGEIAEADMSLAALKRWIRAHGQTPSEPGGALMLRNQSYIFFSIDHELDPAAGPIGGAGVSLAPLRSIAIDRAVWSYGLPVWIEAEIPWQGPSPTPFRRLMTAQDTGSAIVGPARADIFFGSGDDAGARAGDIRRGGEFVVFLPVEEGAGR